jgi:hypothetical protein
MKRFPNNYLFMKRTLYSIIAVSALALVQTTFAAFETFTVSLDGAQDGGLGRTGSGSGTITFDNVANTLTFNNIAWSGLSANSTAAHIHGPGAPGVPAGVLYPLNPTYTTVGGTSGTFSGTLPLVTNPNGTTFTIADQVTQLEGGLWYLNIHSTAFGGGEIRGQVLPVPEPSTLALIALGTGALIWRLRRKS